MISKKMIEFKDNSYYVQLPWHENKIDLVSSNYQIALRVLDRTPRSLERREMDKAYNEGFFFTTRSLKES